MLPTEARFTESFTNAATSDLADLSKQMGGIHLSSPSLTHTQITGLDDPQLLAQCVLEAPFGSSLRRIGLGLSGLYCAACAITIEDALLKVPGVLEVQVQAASQRSRILLDPAQVRMSMLVEAVQQAGYKAWPDTAVRAGHERLRERRRLLWRLSVAALCMMQVMMIAWAQYVGGRDIPSDLWNLMNWACWVISMPVMLFSCGPFFKGAWQAARQGRVAMDTPVALGIATTFVVSTGVTFGGQATFGHDAYFDSLTMFVTFLLAGRWLESRAREQVTQSLESLCVRLPEAVDRRVQLAEQAHVGHDDGLNDAIESVPFSALRSGDQVRVAVGQAFPADGQLLSGQTEVDESLLTGESRSVPRQTGQLVVAGSINLGAPVWMRVERLGPDTRHQQIVSLVHQALTQKPEWMRSADRVAGPFLWVILFLAGAGALAWQWVDPSRSVWVAVSVLVVTCPCALSLAAPAALLTAAGTMAKHGLLVRRIEALETLATVDRIFFDKTGTLTEGELTLVCVLKPDGAMAQLADPMLAKPLAQAAALAACSQHPLSRSLVQAVQSIGMFVPPNKRWTDVREEAGLGVQAVDEHGLVWRLGSAAWALAEAAPSADHRARVWLSARNQQGQVRMQDVVGFVFDEAYRAEAKPALHRLKALGCDSLLLSGDQADRVAAAAQYLGDHTDMTVAKAQATPEEKLKVVAEVQAQGHRVAVVGDGINDAPVLAQADVSVALDQGAALAQSQADLIILNGRLMGLPLAIETSRRAVRIVQQNWVWAVSYNLVCVPLALMGRLPPWLAGLGMAFSSLLVVLNALRLRTPPSVGKH